MKTLLNNYFYKLWYILITNLDSNYELKARYLFFYHFQISEILLHVQMKNRLIFINLLAVTIYKSYKESHINTQQKDIYYSCNTL